MPTPEELGLLDPSAPSAPPGDGLGEWASAWDGSEETRNTPDNAPVGNDPLSWLIPGSGTSAVSPTQQTQAGGVNWDSPQNPYRQQVQQMQQQAPTPAQRLAAEVNGYAQQREQAYAILVTPVEQGGQGMDPTAARAVTHAAFLAASAEARSKSLEAVTAPSARRQVAEILASQYSTPQHRLDPRMLLEENSPAGMEARARTIAGFARQGAFAGRAQDRVDMVEVSPGGSGGTPAVDLASASPFEMIRSGLRSSRNTR